jgi:hypothetical protein
LHRRRLFRGNRGLFPWFGILIILLGRYPGKRSGCSGPGHVLALPGDVARYRCQPLHAEEQLGRIETVWRWRFGLEAEAAVGVGHRVRAAKQLAGQVAAHRLAADGNAGDRLAVPGDHASRELDDRCWRGFWLGLGHHGEGRQAKPGQAEQNLGEVHVDASESFQRMRRRGGAHATERCLQVVHVSA